MLSHLQRRARGAGARSHWMASLFHTDQSCCRSLGSSFRGLCGPSNRDVAVAWVLLHVARSAVPGQRALGRARSAPRSAVATGATAVAGLGSAPRLQGPAGGRVQPGVPRVTEDGTSLCVLRCPGADRRHLLLLLKWPRCDEGGLGIQDVSSQDRGWWHPHEMLQTPWSPFVFSQVLRLSPTTLPSIPTRPGHCAPEAMGSFLPVCSQEGDISLFAVGKRQLSTEGRSQWVGRSLQLQLQQAMLSRRRLKERRLAALKPSHVDWKEKDQRG